VELITAFLDGWGPIRVLMRPTLMAAALNELRIECRMLLSLDE